MEHFDIRYTETLYDITLIFMIKIKIHRLIILSTLLFFIVPHHVFSAQAMMPACRCDLEGHQKIVKHYLKEKGYDFYVIEESAEFFGPCKNVNTQSTKFKVENDIGEIVGEISVNGSTNEVSFDNYEHGAEQSDSADQTHLVLLALIIIIPIALVALLTKRLMDRGKN